MKHPEYIAMPTYADWLCEVAGYIESDAGFQAADLPVQPYREWWEEMIDAREAATRALASIGFPNGKQDA